jgi:hypothetical protein
LAAITADCVYRIGTYLVIPLKGPGVPGLGWFHAHVINPGSTASEGHHIVRITCSTTKQNKTKQNLATAHWATNGMCGAPWQSPPQAHTSMNSLAIAGVCEQGEKKTVATCQQRQ